MEVNGAQRLTADEAMKYGLRGYKDIVPYNWHGKMITVRYFLTRDEETEVIHSILRCCSSPENEEVIPEFVDLAMRANIVAAYTSVNLPEGIEDQHKLLYCSDLYDVVLKNANQVQIKHIAESVNMYLGY